LLVAVQARLAAAGIAGLPEAVVARAGRLPASLE
jgi:hypothetical protein